jgi:hypothetical protein
VSELFSDFSNTQKSPSGTPPVQNSQLTQKSGVQNYEFYLIIKKKLACFIWFSRVYLALKDYLTLFTVIFR